MRSTTMCACALPSGLSLKVLVALRTQPQLVKLTDLCPVKLICGSVRGQRQQCLVYGFTNVILCAARRP